MLESTLLSELINLLHLVYIVYIYIPKKHESVFIRLFRLLTIKLRSQPIIPGLEKHVGYVIFRKNARLGNPRQKLVYTYDFEDVCISLQIL